MAANGALADRRLCRGSREYRTFGLETRHVRCGPGLARNGQSAFPQFFRHCGCGRCLCGADKVNYAELLLGSEEAKAGVYTQRIKAVTAAVTSGPRSSARVVTLTSGAHQLPNSSS
jgi:hypothetical protein